MENYMRVDGAMESEKEKVGIFIVIFQCMMESGRTIKDMDLANLDFKIKVNFKDNLNLMNK